MTRALRRVAPLLLAALTASMLLLALLAGPASATEGEEAADEAAEELTGFGSGQWDGLVLAAITGVVIGGLGYAMSDPGGIHKVTEHH